MSALSKIFGSHSERELKRIYPIADKVESYKEAMGKLSDEELKDKTREFKKRLEDGATLDDILEALGTNLHDFFDQQEDEQLVFGKKDFFVNEQDDYIIHYIVPNAQKNEMEPILIELENGKRSMKMEPHGGEEFGYVLEGKVVLHYGMREEIVKKGETFYLKGTRAHYLENQWERKARVIWISTPPLF